MCAEGEMVGGWGRRHLREVVQLVYVGVVVVVVGGDQLLGMAGVHAWEETGVSVPVPVPVPPPLPVLPLPTAAQLEWQRREMALFFHFGMNTYTGSEWGRGDSLPSTFAPPEPGMDTRQWARVARAAGASLVILTAKHHDGFCLWPSAYTPYSVRASPWRGGRGDVVADLAASARDYGLDLGLYLSPWDRHDPRYGRTRAYNEYYLAQLRELLTRYGTISEIWFDGAKGPDAPKMKYMFKSWFATVHALQAKINIFSDAGPDVRWVGDENGTCGLTCWSMMNVSHARIGLGADLGVLNNGDPIGNNWVPAECDVSIRHGWFWHANEKPKSPKELLNLYYRSVGRNCVLLLNVPPNSTGLVSQEDVASLTEFKRLRDSIFSENLASNFKYVRASSVRGSMFKVANILDNKNDTYWASYEGLIKNKITIALKYQTKFNVVGLREPIWLGQRIAKYKVQVRIRRKWKTFSEGTTIGYQKLDLGCTNVATYVRLTIMKARGDPLISSFALHFDPISNPANSSHCK